MNSVEGFIYFLLSIFCLIAVVGIYLIISYMRRYRLICRDFSGRRVLFTSWVFEVLDRKDNTTWWKSWFLSKGKVKIPAPPQDCLSYDNRGKPYVEVRQISHDEYIYCKPNKFNSKDKIESDGTTVFDGISKPFSKVQREVIMQGFIKAERVRRKGESTLSKIAIPLGALFILGLIIIFIIMYWGELAQAHLQMQGQTSELLKQAKETISGVKGTAQSIGQSAQPAKQGGG